MPGHAVTLTHCRRTADCARRELVLDLSRRVGFAYLETLRYMYRPRIFSLDRVGNSSLLGHWPFGLDVNLIFKGTEASWEGTKATFHPSPGAPRPV